MLGREPWRSDVTSSQRELKNLIHRQTYNCHELRNFVMRQPTSCPMHRPAGKTSCAFNDLEAPVQTPLELTSLEGVWYLTGRSDSRRHEWDSGVLFVKMALKAHSAVMTFTGLVSYDSERCFGPFKVAMKGFSCANVLPFLTSLFCCRCL